jgi:hypothetical protein
VMVRREEMRLGESNAMIRCQVTCVVDVRLVVVVDDIDRMRGYDATYVMD